MDGRRSVRRSIVLPVLLSGTDFNGLAFKENTWTIGVNRHGAKISTSYRLAVGDQITVGNPVLGHSTKARVIRVAEKGRAFEIGVELVEPQDVWGAKFPPEDLEAVRAHRDDGGGVGKADDRPRAAQNAEAGPPAKTKAEEAAKIPEVPVASSDQQPSNPRDQVDLRPPPSAEEAAGRMPQGDQAAPPAEPRFDSLADFLRASRAELKGLLAKVQEVQQISGQALQSLFEEVHVRLHQELEAASAGFVNETRRRVQREAYVAFEAFNKEASTRQTALLDDMLTQIQATRHDIELSMKEGADEYQERLGESSAAAVDEIQRKGESLFQDFRNELHKTLEDLKKKGASEVSEHLRVTAEELADEVRRRAEVGFEILNERLNVSGKVLLEASEKEIASLRQSAFTSFTREASDAVSQQVGLGVNALKEAADHTKVGLENHFHQSIEAFQKQTADLSKAALEKYNKTSEFLLHDLKKRLDQAARALQLAGLEAESTSRRHTGD